MYDMYPWDTAVSPRPAERAATRRPGRPAGPPAGPVAGRRAAHHRPVQGPGPAACALQVALDRRDNGGAGAPACR